MNKYYIYISYVAWLKAFVYIIVACRKSLSLSSVWDSHGGLTQLENCHTPCSFQLTTGHFPATKIMHWTCWLVFGFWGKDSSQSLEHNSKEKCVCVCQTLHGFACGWRFTEGGIFLGYCRILSSGLIWGEICGRTPHIWLVNCTFSFGPSHIYGWYLPPFGKWALPTFQVFGTAAIAATAAGGKLRQVLLRLRPITAE